MGYKEHQKVLKESMEYVQMNIPEIRMFQRHVGIFKTLTGSLIKINFPGMSDMYCLVPTKFGMMHIECECKTGNSKLSKVQQRWRDFIITMNGDFILFHDKEELLKGIKLCMKRFQEF